MSTAPTGEERLDRRVPVVDLDGQPLAVLSVLEELLADRAAWVESDAADPPQIRAPLRLPASLAGGAALDAVRRLAAALGRPGLEPDLVDVLTAYADRLAEQLAGRHTPADRAGFVARIAALAGLLDLAPTAATQLLIARLASSPPGLDLALTDVEEAAYAATAARIHTLWAAGSTLAELPS